MQVIESPETRIVLENVRWETFLELSEQRRVSLARMTYDNGVLQRRFDFGEIALMREFRQSIVSLGTS